MAGSQGRRGEGSHKVLGVEVAKFRIPMDRRMQTFAVFFWIFNFMFSGLLASCMLLYLLLYTQMWPLPLAYMAWMYWDWDTCNSGGRTWGWSVRWVRGWQLWRDYADYFPVKIVKTCELPPSSSYLLGSHPHGVLCSGAFCAFATNGAGFEELYPGLQSHLLSLEGQFSVPGWHREILYSTGSCAATKRGMEALLSRPEGTATVLVVGGAPESLNSEEGTIRLVLNRRKGFIKLALRFGVDLVPTFTFGEHLVYNQVPNPEGSLVRRVQEKLLRVVGLAPVLFFGRGMFQYNWGIVPHRTPLHVVIGRPIAVTKVTDPSREEIESLHREYVEALVRLYRENNPQYGYLGVQLVID